MAEIALNGLVLADFKHSSLSVKQKYKNNM